MIAHIKRTPRAFGLPAVFLLTLLFGYWSYFFIVARAGGMERVAAWTLFCGVVGVYALMLYSGNLARYRKIFFIAIALLFFPEFVGRLLETRGSMMVGAAEMFKNETPFCHIVIPMVALPFTLTGKVVFPAGVNWIYQMVIIWLTATLTIGRGWCSWACFYGGWDEGASGLAKKVRLKISPKNDRVRYFGFVMLAFVVLASLGSLVAVYCEWLCPFKMVTEFGDVNSLRSFIAFILFVLAFFGLVIVLPFLTKKRTQCMSFCPFGAFQSLLNTFNLYRLRIDTEKCTGCMVCVDKCSTMSLDEASITEKKGKPLLTCTRCGDCITHCPAGAVDYAYVLKQQGCEDLLSRLQRKWSLKEGLFAVFAAGMFRMLREVLSARALFTFSGFFLGMVILSAFGTGTIHRIFHFFLHGSFLLK